MARRGNRYGTRAPTQAQRRARCISFLINARSLDGISDEKLAHDSQLPVKTIAELRARAGG